MYGSILSVHVINGDNLNLKRGGVPSVIVKVSIESQRQMTSIVGGNHPVWNEILTFDINNGREELMLSVEDRQSGEIMGTASVSLGFFTQDEKSIDQLAKDMKVKLVGGAEGAELRLKLHWIYSKVNLLEDLLEELRRVIRQT